MSAVGFDVKGLFYKDLKEHPSDWNPIANVLARVLQFMKDGNYGIAIELIGMLIEILNEEHKRKSKAPRAVEQNERKA